MRNVQRVHAPIGFGVYVHRRGRFSEVEHYKCTPGEPSRSTEIDLPGRISREGQVHRKRNRVRSLARVCGLCAHVCAHNVCLSVWPVTLSEVPSDGILQALNLTRRREAKIDLFSSFAGWLTNAVEEGRRRREGESEFG